MLRRMLVMLCLSITPVVMAETPSPSAKSPPGEAPNTSFGLHKKPQVQGRKASLVFRLEPTVDDGTPVTYALDGSKPAKGTLTLKAIEGKPGLFQLTLDVGYEIKPCDATTLKLTLPDGRTWEGALDFSWDYGC